jgi:hypothetical protein
LAYLGYVDEATVERSNPIMTRLRGTALLHLAITVLGILHRSP